MVGIGPAIRGRGTIPPIFRRHIDLTPDNGLNAGLGRLSVKLDHSEHVPMIGDGHGIHSQRLAFIQHPVNPNGAVQQAVFRVNMKVNKG